MNYLLARLANWKLNQQLPNRNLTFTVWFPAVLPMDSTKPIKKEPFEDSPSTQDPPQRPESGGLKMTPKDTGPYFDAHS